MTKTILITGSAGFIFSNFIRKVFDERLPYKFVSVDKVIAQYNLKNIFKHTNHAFYMGDIADEVFMNNVFNLERPDIIIHGAAESFVDDAIKSAQPFVHSNIMGTQVMIDLSLKYGVERFVYISTDEVYGQLKVGDKSWTETSQLKPRNPYSASKACGEMLVIAANQTHGLNYNITRCCNNYGPRQPPRNLVPRVITSILNNKLIPIHGEGKQIREWIYVEDHCSAIIKIVELAPPNEIYNVGSGVEWTNLEMVSHISRRLKIKDTKINFIKDRAGHDFRYSVDCSKIKNLGWNISFNFDKGLMQCINWYLENSNYYDY
jgi:dTDP-glucose 4,6-dehydratase